MISAPQQDETDKADGEEAMMNATNRKNNADRAGLQQSR